MTVCGIDEIAAQVDITLNTDAVRALSVIYGTKSAGVTVHEVAIAFGRVDVIALITTSLESDARIEHPTMRLARWVNKVRNLRYVTSTVTTILVHDPEHDERHRARAKASQAPGRSAGARRRRPSRKRRATKRE